MVNRTRIETRGMYKQICVEEEIRIPLAAKWSSETKLFKPWAIWFLLNKYGWSLGANKTDQRYRYKARATLQWVRGRAVATLGVPRVRHPSGGFRGCPCLAEFKQVWCPFLEMKRGVVYCDHAHIFIQFKYYNQCFSKPKHIKTMRKFLINIKNCKM